MTDIEPTDEQLIITEFVNELINGEPTNEPLIDVARTALLWYIEQRSQKTSALDTHIGAKSFMAANNSDTFDDE